MGGFLVVIGLALVAAVGVIVLANAASGGGTDVRTFWADLRSGLRRRREPDGADADEVEEPEPVDVPFDRFFAEAPQADDGYLQLDELADMLERTGERAGRLRERLPSARVAGPDASGAPGRVVVQDRVTAPASAGPAPAAPTPARRSGHLPVRRVGGGAGAPAGAVAAPPAVPPQRAER